MLSLPELWASFMKEVLGEMLFHEGGPADIPLLIRSSKSVTPNQIDEATVMYERADIANRKAGPEQTCEIAETIFVLRKKRSQAQTLKTLEPDEPDPASFIETILLWLEERNPLQVSQVDKPAA